MKWYVILPSIVVVSASLALGVYLAISAAQLGMWIDELYTLHAIKLPWADMLLERLRRGHPPLYFALEKILWDLTENVFHSAELRLRLLSLTSWAAAAGVFALLAKRLLTTSGLLVAASVFTLSHIAGVQAANGRMYALALFFSTLHLTAYLKIITELREKPSNSWLLYVATSILGTATTPSFFLLIAGTAATFFFIRPHRVKEGGLALATLAMTLIFYLPAVYFYAITPHQLGPVSKHFSRIPIAIAALLTGIGRGKLPEESWREWFGFICSFGIALTVFAAVITRRRSLSDWQKRLVLVFLAPFVVYTAFALVSLVPFLRFLRIGTDRYLIVFVPVGALLTASVLERITKENVFGFFIAGLTFVLLGTFPRLSNSEGRFFKEEMTRLRNARLSHIPAIVCPPEIVDGVNYYCPGLPILATFGINSRNTVVIRDTIDTTITNGTALLVYYRAHVPEVLKEFREAFTSTTLLSKRIYGSKQDPIFAVYLFSAPKGF